jgi:hypothetical protein
MERLQAEIFAILINEAPANTLGWIKGWIHLLANVGGQSALDMVASEASKAERYSVVGSSSRATYAKIAALATKAQHEREAG